MEERERGGGEGAPEEWVEEWVEEGEHEMISERCDWASTSSRFSITRGPGKGRRAGEGPRQVR